MIIFVRNRLGVTFTEIVIAFFILGFAIVPLHRVFSQGLDTVREMRDYMIVMHIAEAQVHKYINIISNLTSGDTLDLQKEDISGEVQAELSDGLESLNGLKVSATVKLSTATGGKGAYDIIIEGVWGSHGKFNLMTVAPIRDFINSAEEL